MVKCNSFLQKHTRYMQLDMVTPQNSYLKKWEQVK